MNVLVVCENETVKKSIKDAVAVKGVKNNYKVVSCGEGKINAAVTTALEINDDVKRYDLVVSAGCAWPVVDSLMGTFAIPNRVAQWDVNAPVIYEDGEVHEVSGVDEMVVLSGDNTLNSNVIDGAVAKYGKDICFDTISFGVVRSAEDWGIDVIVIKYFGNAEASMDSVVSYIESVA